MRLQELIDAMEAVAPCALAEPWDNVGLITGDPEAELSRVLLTIDYTPEVAAEAIRLGVQAVISYHPPIFDPLKRVIAGSLIYDAIRHGLAIYSPHTALDACEGGTHDMLADVLGLIDRRPIRRSEPGPDAIKIVTFVPADHADRVAQAAFAAGAGRIGEYTKCSFRVEGAGTFLGGQGTHPTVGTPGNFERHPEIRLETVVPLCEVARVVVAVRESHPYEVPAIDLIPLVAPPSDRGHGRIGSLRSGTSRQDVFDRVRKGLGIEQLLIAGPTEGEASVAACCGGSCGKMIHDASDQGAEFYLTGEVSHHHALAAAAAGMTVICTLHSNSERAVLTRLAGWLTTRLQGLDVICSSEDRDPFVVV